MELDLSKIHQDFLTHVPYNYDQENLIIIDLITIVGSIYYYDIKMNKNGDNPRIINIDIPVYHEDYWRELIKEIEELAKWVSEDVFNISFIKNNYFNPNLENIFLLPNEHNVSLFSGGLDSLSGAYYNYKNSIPSDYIGFVNKGEERTKQLEVKKFYKKIFDDNTSIQLVEKLSIKKTTYIQSTRSLLYLALAIAKAHFNKSNNIYLFENGILSLNPELHNRYTTKTTHPKTIYLYNSLLKKLKINIYINHPFLFKTKGEIINDMNITFRKVIKDTFTCGQGRTHPERGHKGQCGTCIPCLLRKISIASFDNEEYDVEYHYPYGVKLSQIKEDVYRKDLESNMKYFQTYSDLIKSKQIHLEIDAKGKYYSDYPEYRLSNKEMFEKFVDEFERYIKKYDPN